MKIAFVIKDCKKAHNLIKILSPLANDYEVLYSPPKETSKIPEGTNLVFGIGGDGTLLHAGRMVLSYDESTPIVGINLGTLGFLTSIPPEKAMYHMEEIISGNRVEESRGTFLVKVKDNIISHALNDIVLKGNSSDPTAMCHCSIDIDRKHVMSVRGDGLIISTPTGSTAYNLSAGGPIVHPSCECNIITPLCPQSLTHKPIVVPRTSDLRIWISPDNIHPGLIVIDGAIKNEVPIGESISVSYSDKVLKIWHPKEYEYYENLRKKLGWGISII